MKSAGTTQDQAITNRGLRHSITLHPEVVAFYDTFVMEDKSGTVVLDYLKACEQVRVVLNNRKRNSSVNIYTENDRLLLKKFLMNIISSRFCIGCTPHFVDAQVAYVLQL